jgi:branched-chain amino acid aminotransferase
MSDDPRSSFIWFDGEILPWDDAVVHVKTHTLHYGLGVFEGTRAYEQTPGGSAVFRLDDHLKRLRGSARVLELPLDYDHDTLRRATLELLRRNRLPSCYIRHIAFLGAGSMGLFPRANPTRVAILAWPWGTYLGEEGMRHGIHCKISSYARHFPNTALLKAKATANYLNSILAKREAIRSGYDEAILLDGHGLVAEGSGENLFIVVDGRLVTPPPTSVLQGITRDTVMRIAQSEGIPVDERHFTRDALYLADEVFLTGTAAEVTPVRMVDHRAIGESCPGPVTRRIQELFFLIVHGERPEWSHWLEPVPVAALR